MVGPGFHFDGPRFFLEILVDPGLVDPGSKKLSFTLLELHRRDATQRMSEPQLHRGRYIMWIGIKYNNF